MAAVRQVLLYIVRNHRHGTIILCVCVYCVSLIVCVLLSLPLGAMGWSVINMVIQAFPGHQQSGDEPVQPPFKLRNSK